MMPDTKAVILNAVKAHFDVPAFASDLIDQAGMPALKKVVADTSNPFDDMILNAAGPSIIAALKAEIAKQWAELGPDAIPS